MQVDLVVTVGCGIFFHSERDNTNTTSVGALQKLVLVDHEGFARLQREHDRLHALHGRNGVWPNRRHVEA